MLTYIGFIKVATNHLVVIKDGKVKFDDLNNFDLIDEMFVVFLLYIFKMMINFGNCQIRKFCRNRILKVRETHHTSLI